MASNPLTASIPVVRESNGATMIESIDLSLPQPTTNPTAAARNDASPPIEPAVQWTVTMLIPNADRFSAYEIRVIGLTRADFKTDRDFLQRIMGSLAYTPPAADQP